MGYARETIASPMCFLILTTLASLCLLSSANADPGSLSRRASNRRMSTVDGAGGGSLVLEQRLDPASLSAGGWDLPWDLPYLVDCWTVTGLLWDTLSSDEFAPIRPFIAATSADNITCEFVESKVYGLRAYVPLVDSATSGDLLGAVSEYDIISAVSSVSDGMLCGSSVVLYFTTDKSKTMAFTCTGGADGVDPVPLPQLCCAPPTPDFPPQPLAPSAPSTPGYPSAPQPPVVCNPKRRKLRGKKHQAAASRRKAQEQGVKDHVVVHHPLKGRWGPNGIIRRRAQA